MHWQFAHSSTAEGPTMNYRSLLVHLDSDKQSAGRVDLAIRLAREHDCHLVGVAATGEVHLPIGSEAAAPHAELEALVWDALHDRAEAAAQQFRDACGAAKFKAFEVVIDERDRATSLVERAHCSDLVILSQEHVKVAPVPLAHSVVEQVVMDSARPTLLIPHTGHFESFGKPALVAWDDSREAARAVLDAMPLLRKCDGVQVVAWKERQVGMGLAASSLPQRLESMQRWLLWHGVTSDVRVESTEIPIAEAMLSRAADLGSGLIVMGAYGHTRLSERVLGGATRTLLQSMTVPVLMSH
jgi:nucleotide-binding universal stress UspA family protein